MGGRLPHPPSLQQPLKEEPAHCTLGTTAWASVARLRYVASDLALNSLRPRGLHTHGLPLSMDPREPRWLSL